MNSFEDIFGPVNAIWDRLYEIRRQADSQHAATEDAAAEDAAGEKAAAENAAGEKAAAEDAAGEKAAAEDAAGEKAAAEDAAGEKENSEKAAADEAEAQKAVVDQAAEADKAAEERRIREFDEEFNKKYDLFDQHMKIMRAKLLNGVDIDERIRALPDLAEKSKALAGDILDFCRGTENEEAAEKIMNTVKQIIEKASSTFADHRDNEGGAADNKRGAAKRGGGSGAEAAPPYKRHG